MDEIEAAGDAGERRDHGPTVKTAAEHVEPRRGVLGNHHREEETVTAMYQEVAIQFGHIGPVHHRRPR